MKKIHYTLIILLLIFPFSTYTQDYNWYKGNTHCHTTNSDGDELPRKVVRWYQDHGYNFLIITDHNFLTEIKYLDTDANDDFILIQGEEVTDSYNKTPIHLNAININKCIEPQHGSNKVETLQNNINAIIDAGGLVQINHPNWRWAFTDKEMSQLKGSHLFEIYNSSYNCNNFGAGGNPGMEEIWERLLSQGILMYGVASDDAHDYTGEFSPQKSNPGTGWIMVKAIKLTPKAIIEALKKGEFYATIGVILKDITITKNKYIIEIIKQEDDIKYTTTFIGKNGKILKESFDMRAVYAFKGDESYVRARIFASSGEFACTQPVFLKDSSQ